jgi:hypothetical protein
MSKMYAIKNMDALRDEIGYAVVCAPDSWMYKEWRSPSEQDSLESVFQDCNADSFASDQITA